MTLKTPWTLIDPDGEGILARIVTDAEMGHVAVFESASVARAVVETMNRAESRERELAEVTAELEKALHNCTAADAETLVLELEIAKRIIDQLNANIIAEREAHGREKFNHEATWNQNKELRERIERVVSAWEAYGDEDVARSFAKEVREALRGVSGVTEVPRQARNEARPALRTRAEVDGEIGLLLRKAYVSHYNDAGREILVCHVPASAFIDLVTEPLAPDAEANYPNSSKSSEPECATGGDCIESIKNPGDCAKCGNEMPCRAPSSRGRACRLARGHTGLHDWVGADEPDRCSCEEALALRKRLEVVRQILREIGAPGIELRKSHAPSAIWAAIGESDDP